MINLRQHGFSIVELVVVIIVLGIIIALTGVGMSIYQRDARDGERASDTAYLAESLEKAYVAKGLYPVCGSMATVDAARAVFGKDFDVASMVAPNSSEESSIKCTDTFAGRTDVYVYLGGTCTAEGCKTFTIKYVKELDGGAVTIASRAAKDSVAATTISAGTSHTCALASGSVFCWGSNLSGQLGTGTFNPSSIPVRVGGVLEGKQVTAVSAGGQHTCAVAEDKVYCWGDNQNGRLGIGTTGSAYTTPMAVVSTGALSGRAVTDLAAGNFHTCVIASGDAFCWGGNSYGSVGNNTTSSVVNTPASVFKEAGALQDKTVTRIVTGDNFTCAIADGKAYCWGKNSPSGTLGSAAPVSSYPRPLAVNPFGLWNISSDTVTDITAGSDHACAIVKGKVYCWGGNPNGQLGGGSFGGVQSSPQAVTSTSVLDGYAALELAAGANHTCVRTMAGTACWGVGADGRLGRGGTSDASSPTTVLVNSGGDSFPYVETVTAGGQHTCMRQGMKLYCFGYGASGALGSGSSNSSYPRMLQLPEQ